MARVITFSRTFPAYHPKKGQPTYFVEGILNTMAGILPSDYYSFLKLNSGNEKVAEAFFDTITEDITLFNKSHTIRAGRRWKAGDKFSPRVWSGKPYNSKMITIAPDIEIKKVWDFEVGPFGLVFINCLSVSDSTFEKVASNDGLTLDELKEWFQYPKPFDGQIICWNESIIY
jgi:hypothetical protein